jgi:hypothetical protein
MLAAFKAHPLMLMLVASVGTQTGILTEVSRGQLSKSSPEAAVTNNGKSTVFNTAHESKSSSPVTEFKTTPLIT